jgi:hypothetical protein
MACKVTQCKAYISGNCNRSVYQEPCITANALVTMLADVTAERDALRDFVVKACQDFTECDKMYIHISYLQKITEYGAYLRNAKATGAFPLTFGDWLKRGVQKEDTNA